MRPSRVIAIVLLAVAATAWWAGEPEFALFAGVLLVFCGAAALLSHRRQPGSRAGGSWSPARFCPHCGRNLSGPPVAPHCPHCGAGPNGR